MGQTIVLECLADGAPPPNIQLVGFHVHQVQGALKSSYSSVVGQVLISTSTTYHMLLLTNFYFNKILGI